MALKIPQEPLKAIKKSIKNLLPRGSRIRPPIAQVFIGGNKGLSSRYGLTNIPSLYSPHKAYPVIYDCSIYDQSGVLLESKSVKLAPYGSYDLVPAKFFKRTLPEFGLFVAKMIPESFFTYSDKHLGEITAHFYALYSDKKSGSLALVHPQATLHSAKWSAEREWRSGLLIDSSKLSKILIMQINPTKEYFSNRVEIYNQDGVDLGGVNFNIPPMGCEAKEVWAKDLSHDCKMIHIRSKKLSAENTKPIIFIYDENDNFFGLHA